MSAAGVRLLAVAPDATSPTTGFAVRVLSLLQALEQQSCVVDFFSLQREGSILDDEASSSRFSGSINPIALDIRPPRWRIPHISLMPESVVPYNQRYTRDVLRSAVRSAISRGAQYDVAIAFATMVMPSVRRVFPGSVVLDTGSVDSLTYKRRVAKSQGLSRIRATATWLKWSAFEARMIRSAASTTVVSENDLRVARRLVPSYRHLALVENGVDADFYSYHPSTSNSKRLIYLGALKYASNYEDLRWFVLRVYPLLKAVEPNIELIVTGQRKAVDTTRFRNDPSIRFIGYVADLRQTMQECAVSIVPTQVGAGTRIKILESLSAGVAVVSTTLGAEGLRVTSGVDIQIADDPVEFARCTAQLLSNAHERLAQAQRGRQLILESYSWAHQGRKLLRILEEAAKTGLTPAARSVSSP